MLQLFADGPLGCGTGRLLTPLLAAGHRVVGLENSRAMLRLAGARLREAGLGQRALLLCAASAPTWPPVGGC